MPIPVDPGHCIPSYAIPVVLGHSMLFHAKLCQSEQSVPFHAKPCQSEQSVPFHAKRCQSEQSCVNPPDITPRGLCRVLPAQCLARRSSPSALRRHLSSATPPQLCDAISALRHHLSSATPSQLCDTISFPDRKTTLSVPKALVATMHEAAYDSSDRLHRLRTSELVSCGPRRHSNRPRHLLGFVAVVVKTAEVASEVISEVIIAVDARLPHYGRVHCSHGKAVACPTRRVSTTALAAVTMPAHSPC